MKELIKNELRQASLGQTMKKAVKTKSYIPLLLFGLDVELDQVFGSKWLLNELFQLGFSISHDEISRFKDSVLAHKDEDPESLLDGVYTQWVADNVDHNVCIIDGKGTFHGMGIIAIGTRKTHNQQQKESGQIRRIESILKSKEITSKKQFQMTWYEGSNILGLSKLAFKPLIQLYFPTTFSSSLGIDILWYSSLLFGTDDKRPNWNGFMQEHSSGEHPSDSKILMLPIINLNPSDDNCIYSTLLFIQNQAKILNIETPAVTFDQALWIKAIETVTAKNVNIVVRLGGFHMLMSFVGSIGYLMDGSGLYRLMETIYAKNTVPHHVRESHSKGIMCPFHRRLCTYNSSS